MKTYKQLIPAAVFLAALQGATAADITGKVSLKGTPPPERAIPEAEPLCGKFMTQKPLKTRLYVTSADGGLGNVFVYVKEGAKSTPPKGSATLLDQINCEYTPYVMGVQAGQPFKIKNSDPVMHNVHATPKVNKEFNFAQPNKDQVNEKQFDKPEIMVRMKCDVHPWMFAYIGVVEHPYWAVTDKDGNFKISGLPAGNYTVEAFHMKAGNKAEKLTVSADDKKTLNFELAVPAAP